MRRMVAEHDARNRRENRVVVKRERDWGGTVAVEVEDEMHDWIGGARKRRKRNSNTNAASVEVVEISD